MGGARRGHPEDELVMERIGRQLHNAREWRDIINTFFHRLSGIEDVHGRKIYR